jgi:sugar phosphate isomerase/epimerase
MLDRRSFLAFAGALAAGRTLGRRGGDTLDRLVDSLGDAPVKKLRGIGVQLYTVRDEMKKDVAATLAHVAKIGYKEVELAGLFDKTPAEFKKLLDDNGLRAPSAHMGIGTPDEWAKSLDAAKTLGCEYVTVPWIDEKQRQSIDDYKKIAEGFNKAAEQANAAGLLFAYHNHDFELKPMGGEVPLDVIYASTDPKLVNFEMDIYWMVHGGADPLAFLKKHSGRIVMVHAKDATAAPDHKMVDVGKGTIPFKKILPGFLDDAPKNDKPKHVFVEHDQPADPWASITYSYNTLSKLLGVQNATA